MRIATAYVIWQQLRLTLSVRFVLPGETALVGLVFLLERLKQLGISSKVLYLDIGFTCTPIIRFLTRRNQPAIVVCPIHGKAKGIRALCQGSASYRMVHTFTDGTQTTLALKASLVQDWQTTPQMADFYHAWPRLAGRGNLPGNRSLFGIECSYCMV